MWVSRGGEAGEDSDKGWARVRCPNAGAHLFLKTIAHAGRRSETTTQIGPNVKIIAIFQAKQERKIKKIITVEAVNRPQAVRWG